MKTGIACLLLGALQIRTASGAVDLETHLSRAITNTVYQIPAPAELAKAQGLFLRTLQAPASDPDLTSQWATLGFEFQNVSAGSESFWLLHEPEGKEAGRGWYLFRTNQESALALQAPHARNDIHTGILSLRMFLRGPARALAASTITRHRADMAHLDNTYFQSFTVAFGRACPRGLVVQLHGFESENHGNSDAAIVASAGTRSHDPWLGQRVQQLRKSTGLRVLAYPQDTKQLGATLNTQGRALLANSKCQFLHLEFSRELRQRLSRENNLLQSVLDSVVGGAASNPQNR